MSDSILTVWASGGWVMVPLGCVAIAGYSIAAYLLLVLRQREGDRISETKLQQWLRSPREASGEVGEIIQAMEGAPEHRARIVSRFAELRGRILPPIDRRLFLLNVLVSAAPLLGLLGTVLGMLTTFEAMAHGNGMLMGSMAAGISEALITTETGLLIAIPGYFLASIARRKRREEEAYIARVESVVRQYYRAAAGRA